MFDCDCNPDVRHPNGGVSLVSVEGVVGISRVVSVRITMALLKMQDTDRTP